MDYRPWILGFCAGAQQGLRVALHRNGLAPRTVNLTAAEPAFPVPGCPACCATAVVAPAGPVASSVRITAAARRREPLQLGLVLPSSTRRRKRSSSGGSILITSAPAFAFNNVAYGASETAGDPGLSAWISSRTLPQSDCGGWPAVLCKMRFFLGLAPIRPLRELGYVSVLQRISRSPPGDSTRRGTFGELALMPVD